MNKYKKIAAAVISTVMAGTMVVSLAACGPQGDNGDNRTDEEKLTKLLNHISTESNAKGRATANNSGWTTAKSYWTYLGSNAGGTVADEYGVLNQDGTIKYSAYSGNSGVTLNLAIGHNSSVTSTTVGEIGDNIKLPDNKTYEAGNLKPAWQQLSTDLNIKFNDVYKGWATNANLTNIMSGTDGANYANVDLYTTDLSYAVQYESATSGTVLNLADYLDKMPNFTKFLQDNPIVYLSLLQAGMNTETGANQALYIAPYFDGNDDIERYCIIRQDWAAKLLNGTSALADNGTKYSESCAATTSAKSYMGTTGSYSIESLVDENGTKITIKKDYDAALAAAKNTTTALGAAYNAIAGAAYAGESGNIVDIMNAALAANKDATGSQLVNLYRAYIDVCYIEDGGARFTPETRADVFNGYDACWDVDDLVAMLRCVKTNAKTLVGDGKSVVGIVPRSGQNDRTPDMVRLAAQLYGVRGADSRYEYTYIAKDGTLKDARNDKEFYEALNNFHQLKAEGLIEDYSGLSGFSFASAQNKSGDSFGFMMYDYSQTQTKEGFKEANITAGYKLSPIVTPVSKWDVDGDGNHTDVMRFTESWRSTKTSGLALNGALAKTENAAKLKAALQLVDYLYSEDGQIVSTYGPMAQANGDGGFWYNTEATPEQVTAGKYFTYKGTKYSGTDYKGKTTPTITDKFYQSFLGNEVNGWSLSKSSNKDVKGAAYNYTNYARMLIGSTLPVGVKDQSFENQLTSSCGKAGADLVGVCLKAGTIKGMTLKIDSNNYWYTCVPTSLPVAANYVNDVLNASSQDHLKQITGTQKAGGDKNFLSIFNHIILYGLTGEYNQQGQTYKF